MATRGFNCLLLSISEIDLPVKRREYNNKTRRPYGASINQFTKTKIHPTGNNNIFFDDLVI